MAHEIETMAWTGQKPWHGLGVEVAPNLSPAEIMMQAGLVWDTVKTPLYYLDNNGQSLKSPSCALIRNTDSAYLDTVSEDWEPVQNIEAVDFMEVFHESGLISMETAGSLKGGQTVFFLGKMKDNFETVANDVTEGYLLFSNFHKYGFSTDVRLTPVRVVCNNTLTMALNGKAKSAVKVTHKVKFDIAAVSDIIAEAVSKLTNYAEQSKFLASRRYERDTLRQFFASTYPAASKGANDNLSRAALQALDLVERQPGAEFAAGSWYQAYNAVTFMCDHVQGRSQENRLASSWYGPNQVRKLSSLKLALDLAGKSPELMAA